MISVVDYNSALIMAGVVAIIMGIVAIYAKRVK